MINAVAPGISPDLFAPSVEALLDVPAATSVFAAGGVETTAAVATYVRFKPGENLLIGFEFETFNGPMRGYTVSCVEASRADVLFAKASATNPRPSMLGCGVTRLDAHTVFYGFPNDARLRRLRWYVLPRKLKRSLVSLFAGRPSASRSGASVLRYKPERRVVVDAMLGSSDAESRRVFVRYSSRRQANYLAQVARTLGDHGVGTPRPLAQLDDGRVAIDKFIGGQILRELVGAGQAEPDAVGAALKGFHEVPIPPDAPVRTIASDLDAAAGSLRSLSLWAPQLRQSAAHLIRVVERCQRAIGRSRVESESQVLIHGDLHDRNVMIDGRVMFVDLERTAAGSVGTDLGCLLGTAIAHGIRPTHESDGAAEFAREVINSYRSAGGSCDPALLRVGTALALIDQAVLVTRHLFAGWSDTAVALLERAAEELS